jgi:hypothetical protein
MRRRWRRTFVLAVFAAGASLSTARPARALEPLSQASPDAWEASPNRNFHALRPLLSGRVLYADEAAGQPLASALATRLSRLSAELFDREGWRSPFAEADPLRIYLARKEAGGVRLLVSRGTDGGRLVRPSIHLDATRLSDSAVTREVGRLFAAAVLEAYGAPDSTFFTAAAADWLANAAETAEEREDARIGVSAPEIDLNSAPSFVGRLFVEEFVRAAGGPVALRQAFDRARDMREEILPAVARAASEASGEKAEATELRFVARLFSALETEPAPSTIGLEDLQEGRFDTAVEAPLALRHRTFLPAAEAAGALRVAWPSGGGLSAAVVRYGDARLPPDVMYLAPGQTRAIPLSGVTRVDFVVEGGTARAPSAPAFFERMAEYPFAGLTVAPEGPGDGARLMWRTASHQQLAGWAVFREELLPDGRVARTGPQLVPSSTQSDTSLRYIYLDTSAAPGGWYRYTVWAVTEDGLLSRAFSTTLKTAE